MPIKRLSQLEREYFVKKAGGADPQEPLDQIKRRYFCSYVGGTDKDTFSELESSWQTKVIATNGGTPNSNYASDLWREMVVSIGEIPGTTSTENQRIFYTNDL